MFNSKIEFKPDCKSDTNNKTSGNAFIKKAMKKAARVLSGNASEKFSTTGDIFVDDFGSLGSYLKPRPINEIFTTMSNLWSIDPELALKEAVYCRMITRNAMYKGKVTEKTQKGQGLKHEGICRLMWVAIYHTEVFSNNIDIFLAAGSWKDLIEMLTLDIEYHGWGKRQLDWELFKEVIHYGLSNEDHSELVKKYLPQILSKGNIKTSRANARTIVGKWLAKELVDGDYAKYRKLKSSGTAHEWQQLISQGKFKDIDFNTIHGRALSKLVNSEFLTSKGLVKKYTEWIKSQPVAKFTGFPYELFKPYDQIPYSISGKNLPIYQEYTINKQFENLIQKGKEGNLSNIIAVIDTSGSMTAISPGTNMSAYGVAKSLALYFAHILEGPFKGHFIEFNNQAILRQWQGSSYTDQYKGFNNNIIGGTNVQSVINLFVSMKSEGVDESDFPNGIICISDGEFNRTGELTNVEQAYKTLRNNGFSSNFVKNFKIILWDVRNSYYGETETKFETYGDNNNVFYMSGFDGAALNFLFDKQGSSEKTPRTARELYEAAMNQELLNKIVIL